MRGAKVVHFVLTGRHSVHPLCVITHQGKHKNIEDKATSADNVYSAHISGSYTSEMRPVEYAEPPPRDYHPGPARSLSLFRGYFGWKKEVRMPPKADPNAVVEIFLRVTGGEVGAASSLAPKIGPLGLSPKKIGEREIPALRPARGG